MNGTMAALDQLLPTKLFVPLLEQDILVRARLLETLTAARGSGTILVSAPAGAGKTTLIADWVRRSGQPTGWLSLDAADDDPCTFLSYLSGAFDSVVPGVGDRVRAMLRATPPPEPRLAAHALIADIAAARLDGIVVIDDYHAVADAAIHEILALLVERVPASATLVVITRSDPPLPLARMRVRRQLVEIREADLRFDAGEAGELISRFCGRALRPESVAALTGRTEGWAAGLQLAGLALRSARDPDAFITDFQGTHAFIADFLTDEVLATIPHEDQQFVVRSSLLERLCGPLCDAALATSGSQALLEELVRSNLFLVPLDAQRRWFRYHHLFADLLRRRSRELPGHQRRTLLGRASAWCEQEGAVDDAILYATRAGEASRAADLVARHGIQALAAGEGFKALRWIGLIPAAIVDGSPDHCVIAAWSHSLGERYEPIGEFAGRALELVARGIRPYPHVDEVALHARILRAGADALEGGGVDRSLEEIAAVLDVAPADSLPARASAELMTGNLHWLAGRYPAGLAANERAREIGLRAGSDLLRLAAATGLAQIHLVRGSPGRAIAAAERELADRKSGQEVLANQIANLCAILARAYLERGDLDATERALRRCRTAMGYPESHTEEWPATTRFGRVRHTAFHSSAPAVHHGLAAFVGLLLHRGRHDAADRYLGALEDSIADRAGPTERVLIDSLLVRLLAARRERSRLQELSKRRFPEPTGCGYWDDVRRLTSARAALGAGDARTARGLLASLLAELERRDAHLALAEAHILHALASAAAGHHDAEARSTDAALESTGPEHRLAAWIETGPATIPLLERAVARASASPAALAHAVSLLATLRRNATAETAAGLDALSDRELVVLRLLTAGHTNQQIARTLFLAVGTVKKHTHNIYAKLGVANRTQAARAGHARGLVVELPASSSD